MPNPRAASAILWPLISLTAITLAFAPPCLAQENTLTGLDLYPTTEFSVSGGLGVGTTGIGGQANASIHHAKGEFILRVAGTTDFVILGPTTSYADIGLLYGRISRSPKSWLRIAAGPTVVWGTEERGCVEPGFILCGRYDSGKSTGVGLGTQVDVVWAPSTFAGVGFSFFGDLNTVAVFGGVTVSLHLGQVR